MKIGDEVRWVSTASGSATEKCGRIIAFVPKGESAIQFVPPVPSKSHIKFQDVNKIDRVLVAVPAGKDGRITYYYCPTVHMLERQK